MLVEALPGYVLLSLAELGLILVGYLVERHYVSRVTVFTNALALNVHLLSLSKFPGGLGLFADFALIFGVVMMAFYAFQKSAPGWAYTLGIFPMSSIIIGMVIWSPLNPWYVNIALGIILQFIHSYSYYEVFPNGSITYQGELSGQVSRFVDNAKIVYENGELTHEVELALTKIETTPWWLEESD